MGFQVTPCAHDMPAATSPDHTAPSSAADHSCKHYSTSVNHAAINPLRATNRRPHVAVSFEEGAKRSIMQLQLAAAAAADAKFDSDTAPCTSASLSLRSSSANFLLSQCSSLASLPSLGLSLNAGSAELIKVHELLQAAGGSISAQCSCSATLKSAGDQVASLGDGFFYSASSAATSSNALVSLNIWSALAAGHGSNFYQISSTGSVSKKEGAGVRAIVVAGDHVFTSHSDLKIRVWVRYSGGNTFSCTGGGNGGSGGGGGVGGGREHKLMAALPTRWDCVARSLTPGGYTQVRRHHRKLWIQHADAISGMAVDAKKGYLYSASWDRSVKVWSLRDFKCMESFRAHDDAINALALSADGFLYTAAADGKIKVWGRDSGARELQRRRYRRHSLVATLEAHRSAVNALAVSADGALLYSGACDKAIVVWEREESAQHACLAGALRGHRQAVLSLATCAATLCSGSADKTIRVWQRLARRLHVCVAVLQGHAAPIKSLSLSLSPSAAAFSPTSASLDLYSAALDHDIKVWQLNLSFTH